MKQSIFFHGKVIYTLYTDDSILAGPNDDELNQVICDMKSTSLELTEEGDLSDFLGVNIDRNVDGTIHLMQPQLINQILHNLEGENVSMKQMPGTLCKILGIWKFGQNILSKIQGTCASQISGSPF